MSSKMDSIVKKNKMFNHAKVLASRFRPSRNMKRVIKQLVKLANGAVSVLRSGYNKIDFRSQSLVLLNQVLAWVKMGPPNTAAFNDDTSFGRHSFFGIKWFNCTSRQLCLTINYP